MHVCLFVFCWLTWFCELFVNLFFLFIYGLLGFVRSISFLGFEDYDNSTGLHSSMQSHIETLDRKNTQTIFISGKMPKQITEIRASGVKGGC